MVMRLDAGLRVDASNHSLRARWDSGAWSTITLTDGIYLHLDVLLAELEAKLAVVSASIAATHVGGLVTLTWTAGHTLDVDWLCPALRDWLGWAAGVIGTTSGTTTAPARCAGTFVATLPWDDPTPVGWDLSLMRARHPSGITRSYRRGLRRVHSVQASVLFAELPQFRSVLLQLARGMPGTLWRDASNSAPWAYDEWFGVVAVQLDYDSYPDTFPDAHITRLTCDLTFREYSP